MNYLESIKKELDSYADEEKSKNSARFFKTKKGEYGHGDKFVGITVPTQRKIAKKFYRDIPMNDVVSLLNNEMHEYRITALLLMVYKYENSSNEDEKTDIVRTYLDNLSRVNNWDLVDSSARKLLGPYLLNREKDLLYKFAESSDLWKQRIAVMTTFHFIKKGQYQDTLKLAEILLNHKHDLMHKAVGWMLREIGEMDYQVEYEFLRKQYKNMPRTMLRYAIEKFEEDVRQDFLKGKI